MTNANKLNEVINEVEGLRVGDIINTMKIGQYAVVLNKSKNHGTVKPPMGLFWDEKDRNRLKFIKPDGEVSNFNVCATHDGVDEFHSMFKVLENREAYFEYVSEFYKNNTNEGV